MFLRFNIDIRLEKSIEKHHAVHARVVYPVNEMEKVGITGAEFNTHRDGELLLDFRNDIDLPLFNATRVQIEPRGCLVEVEFYAVHACLFNQLSVAEPRGFVYRVKA